MGLGTEGLRGPVLLCYDGSDAAGRAIARAGRVLGDGKGIVLTVWESLGSAILRRVPSGETEFGRDAKGIAEDVVAELDAGTAERAGVTAGQGRGACCLCWVRRASAGATCVGRGRRAQRSHHLASRPGRRRRGGRCGDCAREPRPLSRQVDGPRQRLLRGRTQLRPTGPDRSAAPVLKARRQLRVESSRTGSAFGHDHRAVRCLAREPGGHGFPVTDKDAVRHRAHGSPGMGPTTHTAEDQPAGPSRHDEARPRWIECAELPAPAEPSDALRSRSFEALTRTAQPQGRRLLLGSACFGGVAKSPTPPMLCMVARPSLEGGRRRRPERSPRRPHQPPGRARRGAAP